MALLDYFKQPFWKAQPVVTQSKKSYLLAAGKPDLTEKGLVQQNIVQFPKKLGEEHPFELSVTEALFKKFGLVAAIIDKYVDFIVGPGFFVRSEDERAQKIIEDFLRDTQFSSLLRAWLREALLKGNGYLELGGKQSEVPQGMKVLNAKFMYVDRDREGELKGYNQFMGNLKTFSTNKVESFEPFEIAHLPLNVVGDCPYGLGVIYPAINTVNQLIGARVNTTVLMERKTNSPYHIKIGAEGENPNQGDVDQFINDLQFLKNSHEWVTGNDIEINAIEFGNYMDKLTPVLEYFTQTLFAEVQIPEVIMGHGSIPEGLAKVQMDAWERTIGAIQEETEKVIEQQIFQRVLRANEIEAHVEFEWGAPSNAEKNARVLKITELLKIIDLSPKMKDMLELELAQLMGLNVALLEDDQEQRDREEERRQPIVPGQNREEEKLFIGELVNGSNTR